MMQSCIYLALAEYGITEDVRKTKHHPRILQYFKEIGHHWVRTDETAWCAAFVNYIAQKAGMETSGKLHARSWLTVGTPITNPQLGDVVIFWRSSPKSWKGHVGFYINQSEDGKWIYVLGGNQQNQVNIKAYPSSRLLGYRRLTPKTI